MKFKRLAIAIAAASLMLAGCGSSGSDAKSGTDTVKKSGSSETITKDNFASVIAKAQAEAKSAHVATNMDMGGQKIPIEGDFVTGDDGKSMKMSVKMEMAGQSMDMRIIDQILYMKFGEMTQGKFIKIDLADKNNPLTKQFGSITGQADPSKSLQDYQDSLKSFEKKGAPEKIDGVEAQPYELILDVKKYFAAAGGDNAPAGLDDIPVTLYIDKDNLMRRTVTKVSGTEVTVDFSKWGEPVTIEKPAADQVGDSSQLEKMLGGQLGAAKS